MVVGISKLGWRFNPSTDGGLAVVLFPTSFGGAGSSFGFARAFNPVDGSLVWDLQNRRGIVEGEPLAVPGHLFFNSYLEENVGSGFASLDSSTGEIQWISAGANGDDVERYSTTSVLVHDGQVYRNNNYPTLPK